MTTSIPEPCTRSQLVGALQHLARCRPRRALLEEAEVELWSLYRSEQADLVLEAARLRSLAPGMAPVSGVDGDASCSDFQASRSTFHAWRRQATECAAACAGDGYPIAPRLADCLALPLPRWPAARDLADEARRLGSAVGGEA